MCNVNKDIQYWSLNIWHLVLPLLLKKAELKSIKLPSEASLKFNVQRINKKICIALY